MQPFIRLLLVCVAACLLLAGCGTGGAESTPTPTANELIDRVAQTAREADSLAFSIEFGGAPVYADPATRRFALVSVEGDLQRPNGALARIRVRSVGAVAEIRLVSLDGQLYATNPITRGWQCYPPGSLFDPVVLFDDEQGVTYLLRETFTDITLLGTEELETLDGPHYHLQGTMPGPPLNEISYGLLGAGEVATDLWIDVASGRVSRIVLVDTGSNPDNPSTWTLNLSDYNKDVDIRAPIACE
jgi:lipoprotein LprG